MLGKLVPYLCIGMAMAMILFVIMRFLFHVPIAGSVVAMLFATLRLRLRLAQPRPACCDQGGEPNAGVANVDDFHVAERLLFRLHFPARNHAVDFLRARRGSAHDLFYRAHARDHFARRTFLEYWPQLRHPHHHVDCAVRSLRAAIPEKDRLKRRQCSVRSLIKIVLVELSNTNRTSRGQ